MKKINIIGLGYIGLPTALMFAAHGVKVVGTDYNKDLVDTLIAGKITFEEQHLQELFSSALGQDIEFTTQYMESEVYIIAVPTPYIKESKKIDPHYVIEAVKSVMKVCPKNAILIIESTISPGTIDKFIRPILTECKFEIGKDIEIVHAPERILPGNMVYELEYNSRTIGADNRVIGEQIKELYSNFCKGDIVVTDIRTAEMTKIVENTYRDINIAFANELTRICRSDNMDVYEIIKIANMHPRVNILQPGPGVGGHCISVDPWFLVGDYPDLTNMILTARKTNDSMPEYVLSRVSYIMKEHKLTDVTRVGLYGLTYKEDVDDIRESPTMQLLDKMDSHLAFGAKVFDPHINKNIVPNQYFDFDEFLEAVDIVVVLVAHTHIKENMSKIKDKIILDTKNICSFDKVYKL